MSPKTQNMHTQQENPMFTEMGADGVPQSQSYFPSHENVGSGGTLSLEQARYLQRMNIAAVRQAEAYKSNVERQAMLTEKEKYA